MKVFGPAYADAYDTLYRDKDYAAECDAIERLFGEYGNGAIRSFLDLGCGTGNHVLPLVERGYEGVGADRSEGMLQKARDKVGELRAVFERGDIRDLDLGRKFDAVLMLFAVLGYQLKDADVRAALGTARRHLRPEGIFLFDVWHGPAVLEDRPARRVKEIPAPEGGLRRVASGELDTERHVVTVRYRLEKMAGDRRVPQAQESHPMRYFFSDELKSFLESAGFALLRLGVPPWEQDLGKATWNIMGVARAV